MLSVWSVTDQRTTQNISKQTLFKTNNHTNNKQQLFCETITTTTTTKISQKKNYPEIKNKTK